MSKTKSKPGATKKKRNHEYVGFRAPAQLKDRLELASYAAGRSMSSEAQFRLEKSFDKEDLLPQVLELAYGSRLSGLVMVLARVMTYAAQEAMAGRFPYEPLVDEDAPGPLDVLRGNNWLNDPVAYHQAARAALEVLTRVRPKGDLSPAEIHDEAEAIIEFLVTDLRESKSDWMDMHRKALGDLTERLLREPK